MLSGSSSTMPASPYSLAVVSPAPTRWVFREDPDCPGAWWVQSSTAVAHQRAMGMFAHFPKMLL